MKSESTAGAEARSAASPSFEPRRFHSTVPYYATYRVPYPEALITFVAERCGLAPGSPVLDLGCGPGQLAIAFARLGCSVSAIDPEPAMLAAAGRQAEVEDVALTLIEGSSYDLDRRYGPFRLVVMGRSFHWMDRDATLNVLDRIVEGTGAVVLFHDKRVATPGADWPSALHRLRTEFVPANVARHWKDDPAWEPHEVVLLRSPFRHLTLHGMTIARTLSVEDVIGLVYSMSSTSPEALGDAREAFEARLQTDLTRLAPNGLVSEIVEIRVLIARRSPGW